MFEEDWLARQHASPMLGYLRHRLTPRKGRLFCLACCQRIDSLLTAGPCRAAISAAERFVEGRATEAEMEQAWRESADFACGQRHRRLSIAATAAATTAYGPFDTAGLRGEEFWATVMRDGMASCGGVCAQFAAEAAWKGRGPNKQLEEAENAAMARLVRELFNPYRRVAFNSAWRTHDALALARAAYESRDFSSLPVLADALQDAGCNDRWLLEHCRGNEKCPACVGVGATDDGPCDDCSGTARRASSGPHVRGCWAVDLVLGMG